MNEWVKFQFLLCFFSTETSSCIIITLCRVLLMMMMILFDYYARCTRWLMSYKHVLSALWFNFYFISSVVLYFSFCSVQVHCRNLGGNSFRVMFWFWCNQVIIPWLWKQKYSIYIETLNFYFSAFRPLRCLLYFIYRIFFYRLIYFLRLELVFNFASLSLGVYVKLFYILSYKNFASINIWYKFSTATIFHLTLFIHSFMLHPTRRYYS